MIRERYIYIGIPGFRTALHSASLRWSGYDMVFSSARALVPNNEPRNDIHEADLYVVDGSRALLSVCRFLLASRGRVLNACVERTVKSLL